MARPKKETVEYFPHYVSSGKTLYILESEFGNDGYAFWFKLLELLGSTDGHVYDCRNPGAWKFLQAKTRVSEDTTLKILNTLAELDAIDQELWNNKLIWSDNFVENISAVYSNRRTEPPQKPVISCSNDGTSEFLHVETDLSSVSTEIKRQSKVKESKVDKSKGEEAPSPQLNYKEVYDYYLTLDLVKHRTYTKDISKSIKKAMDDNNYSVEYCKSLLDRHKKVVEITQDDGKYAVRPRPIFEFFGQKVKGATHLICSEYEEGGKYYEKYIRGGRNAGTVNKINGNTKEQGDDLAKRAGVTSL